MNNKKLCIKCGAGYMVETQVGLTCGKCGHTELTKKSKARLEELLEGEEEN